MVGNPNKTPQILYNKMADIIEIKTKRILNPRGARKALIDLIIIHSLFYLLHFFRHKVHFFCNFFTYFISFESIE